MRQFAATIAVGLMLVACQSVGHDAAEPAAIAVPAHAAPVITGALAAQRKDVVTPDANLAAFLADFAAKAGRSRSENAPESDYADVANLFAPRLIVLSRGLEPDRPWRRVDRDNRPPLALATSFLVEQGDLPDGVKVPDYRPDLMKELIRHSTAPMTYGRMPGFPGAVCSEAQLTVDWTAAKAFAATEELDTASLRLFLDERPLYVEPKAGATSVGTLPALTLFLSDYDAAQGEPPKGWSRIALSNGIKGWVLDPDDSSQGLSQQHICFGRLADGYKVLGFYAYGL